MYGILPTSATRLAAALRLCFFRVVAPEIPNQELKGLLWSIGEPELLQILRTDDPHADKHNPDRNPVLYYASEFMKWLLLGVFGFFGLHAMLWFPRGFAERRRHNADTPEPPTPSHPTGAAKS
jgi:hypothetical protein